MIQNTIYILRIIFYIVSHTTPVLSHNDYCEVGLKGVGGGGVILKPIQRNHGLFSNHVQTRSTLYVCVSKKKELYPPLYFYYIRKHLPFRVIRFPQLCLLFREATHANCFSTLEQRKRFRCFLCINNNIESSTMKW